MKWHEFKAIHPVVLSTIYFIDFITVKTQQSLAIHGCKIVTY
jgi:hypothetical protein